MELGQQGKEESLLGGGLEGVVAVHVHTRSVHWQGSYEAVRVPNGIVEVRGHEELKVACSIRLQQLVGSLPPYQARQ